MNYEADCRTAPATLDLLDMQEFLLLRSYCNNAVIKKLKQMCTPHFKVKLYLQSEMLTQKEEEMLAALRSHCVQGMKHNFLKT